MTNRQTLRLNITAADAVMRCTQIGLRSYAVAGGLEPSRDFRGIDMRGWDLAGQDLRGFDFSGSDLRNTRIENARIDAGTRLEGVLLDEGVRPGSAPLDDWNATTLIAIHSWAERLREENPGLLPVLGREVLRALKAQFGPSDPLVRQIAQLLRGTKKQNPIEKNRVLGRLALRLLDGKLMPVAHRNFDQEPRQMLRILKTARDRELELHPRAIRALAKSSWRAVELRGDPWAAKVFTDLICGKTPSHRRSDRHPDGAHWLAIMNKTGFINYYIDAWARIVDQPSNAYIESTVDKHTIEATRILNSLERGELAETAPVASGLVNHLRSRRVLYLAMLLHGGDNSEIGAEVALKLGPELSLPVEEIETVSWLVLHYPLLSRVAFKRDLEDPKTILDVADVIQSPERLRLLMILTVADMCAVSPKFWNGWKATLLNELYARVAEVLTGGLSTTERDVRVPRARAAAATLLSDWDQKDIQSFLSLGYPGYWLSFDPETHARHARLLRDAEARQAPLTVDTQPLPSRAVTEVTVYCADHVGLFSKVSGALAAAGASLVDARIHTMTNGKALDTFWVQDAAADTIDRPYRLVGVAVLIEQALSGRLQLGAKIRKMPRATVGRRKRARHVPPRVVIDNHASNTHTVLEVEGHDKPELLHYVTEAIGNQGLQISSAHLTAYNGRAVNVFYVKDVFGLKVETKRKLASLRDELLQAVTKSDETAPP